MITILTVQKVTPHSPAPQPLVTCFLSLNLPMLGALCKCSRVVLVLFVTGGLFH